MKTRVYAGRVKDRSVLQYCSSGGAFTALSDVFLKNDDAILCSGYNYITNRAEFRMVFTSDERDACRGSMYMQSYALNSWRMAADWLKNNPTKKLIFFGMGCQGAGFVEFSKKERLRDRITVVDIICHGSPSPMIWREFAEGIKKNGELSNINFRDKRTGWRTSSGVANLNGIEISLSPWRKLYSSLVALRPCCSKCPYTCIDRDTDITIGDFWHLEKSQPDFYDQMGTSIFLIHTEKGMRLFEKIKDQIDYRESNEKDCLQYNLEKPTQHSLERPKFWREYKTKGIEFVMRKYGNPTMKDRMIRKVYREIKKYAKGI